MHLFEYSIFLYSCKYSFLEINPLKYIFPILNRLGKVGLNVTKYTLTIH